jgi:hypothetical protein
MLTSLAPGAPQNEFGNSPEQLPGLEPYPLFAAGASSWPERIVQSFVRRALGKILSTFSGFKAVVSAGSMVEEADMNGPVLVQLTALKSMSVPNLKARWRELFDTPPPPYNRRFLESRLAYRIQELQHGGLPDGTVERLDALAEAMTQGRPLQRKGVNSRPVAGTMLVRQWQGAEHTVTVRVSDFEYQGRPYKSLSSIARTISGTRWNGWTFFGLKKQGGRP